MNANDRDAYIKRYTQRLEEHGYSPKTLGWGKSGRQDVRFSVLAQAILDQPLCSVLDVGCGFGDLYSYLKTRNWSGHYEGLDLVPGLIEVGQKLHPGVSLRVGDFNEEFREAESCFDFVVASGIFNARLLNENNEEHIEKTISHMYRLARKAVCIDFMSTFVEFQRPDSWHTDPIFALRLASTLSQRFYLRHDYMPFEFSLFIFKNDSISQHNIFIEYEKKLSSTQ